MTFAEIENIAGVPIDHSFLTFKKELLQYGFKVVKISMKELTVDFEKSKRRLKHGIKEIELVVASSIGADLAMAFLT